MAEKLHTRLDRIEKERGLFERPRAEARDEIILLYLEFAQQLGSMAADRNPAIDRDDAISEATLGLITATDKYDPSNGALPSTYFGWRIRGGATEAARQNDFVSHKVRATDRALRARLDAGDETVSAVDLLPDMTTVQFESSSTRVESGIGVLEPEARPDLSPIERDTLHLEKMLDAADPVVARHVREALEVQRHPDVISKRTDVAAVLAERWNTTPEGAATIYRSCIAALQTLQVAA